MSTPMRRSGVTRLELAVRTIWERLQQQYGGSKDDVIAQLGHERVAREMARMLTAELGDGVDFASMDRTQIDRITGVAGVGDMLGTRAPGAGVADPQRPRAGVSGSLNAQAGPVLAEGEDMEMMEVAPKPGEDASSAPPMRGPSTTGPGRRPRGLGLLEDVVGGRLQTPSGIAGAIESEAPDIVGILTDTEMSEEERTAALNEAIQSTTARQGPTDIGGLFGQGDHGVEIRGTRRGTGVTGVAPGDGSLFEIRELTEGRAGAPGNAPFEESGSIVVPTAVAQSLTEAQRRFLPYVIDMANQYGVPVGVLFGLLQKESGFNPEARSPANSNGTRDYGIAQINSDTLAGMGKTVEWALNPYNAIRYAAQRLGGSIQKYGSLAAALIEYNGGAGRADEFIRTGAWPYDAAESYVTDILGYADQLDPMNTASHQYDGPDLQERPLFEAQLAAPRDVESIARQVAQSLLGRDPNEEEMAQIVEAVRDQQYGEQLANFNNKLFGGTPDGQMVPLGGEQDVAGAVAPGQIWGDLDKGVTWAQGQTAWGGQYQNGLIPDSALVDLGGGQKAHPAAAAAWRALEAAARADGINLGLTDSYRTLQGQKNVAAAKPGLAAPIDPNATEGRSIHGWGLAFDLSGIGGFGSAAYKWLAENGARFGFTNPEWARQGGSKPEHWHWEYIGGGVGGASHVVQNQQTSVYGMVDDLFRQRYPEEAAAYGYYKQGNALMQMIQQGGAVVG